MNYIISEKHLVSLENRLGIILSGPRQHPLSEVISEQRCGCLTCFDKQCPVWQAADQNCWRSGKE